MVAKTTADPNASTVATTIKIRTVIVSKAGATASMTSAVATVTTADRGCRIPKAMDPEEAAGDTGKKKSR